MTFRALVIDATDDPNERVRVRQLAPEQLPPGNVTVSVEFSSLNYKDALCMLPSGGGLVKRYPHVPGIDFAGTVEVSTDPRYRPGDRVVLTGWRVGETHWGGLSGKARVSADWLVPLPESLSTKDAMSFGTAGFAAMLAVSTLEDHGLRPEHGEVIVTGASGGVGSAATAILSRLGYSVTAVTGRPESEHYLRSLGAARIANRGEFTDTEGRALESSRWAGCVDAVGGKMLVRILSQLNYGASAAAVGLAAGADLQASLIPFLLRGINLLGIDSVMQPLSNRLRIWQGLAADLPPESLAAMTTVVGLADVPKLATEILEGRVRGRIVVDVSR